jgi:hypothetical protein
MYSTTDIAIIGLLLLIVLVMSAKATILVVRDDLSDSAQRKLQLLLVWLIPIIGSLIVFAVHRKAELPSRKYREKRDVYDDEPFPRIGSRGRSHESPDDD